MVKFFTTKSISLMSMDLFMFGNSLRNAFGNLDFLIYQFCLSFEMLYSSVYAAF